MGKIYVLYFSPTGNVRKMVIKAAEKWALLADSYEEEIVEIDYTKKENRGKSYSFQKEDLLVIGMPVYAGRIPNKVMPELRESLQGQDTSAICLVSYGNRNFDEGLRELILLCEEKGFSCIGGMACVGEHAFSKKLAKGRPDDQDIKEIENYIEKVRKKHLPVNMDRQSPIGPYYTPLKEDKTPAKFLKARVKTDEKLCSRCGKCIAVCPTAVILEDCISVEGPCIKCQACVKVCPEGAKYFDDENFLSHVAMLEANYRSRKENVFLAFEE